MKKNIIKATSILTAAAALTAMAAVSAEAESKLFVDGKELENAKIYKTDSAAMIPLRAVCEELGFEVKWSEENRRIEIINMPVMITCTPDADGYTFAKSGKLELGIAPVIIDDLTYVPISFAEEILGGKYTEEENSIYITYNEAENTVTDTIGEIITEEDGAIIQILLGDPEQPNDALILNVSEETAVYDENAVELSLADLKVGDKIIAHISDAMTKSIPAQTAASRIDLAAIAESEEQTTVIEGKICEIAEGTIIVGSAEDVYSQTILNITEETEIIDADGNKTDASALTVGTEISAEPAEFMTMSIPPQTNALKITIK